MLAILQDPFCHGALFYDGLFRRALWYDLRGPEGREACSHERWIRAEILTYGATVHRLCVPGSDGRPGDVVSGLDVLKDHGDPAKNFSLGCVIGRFALDGTEHHLTANSPPNTHHAAMTTISSLTTVEGLDLPPASSTRPPAGALRSAPLSRNCSCTPGNGLMLEALFIQSIPGPSRMPALSRFSRVPFCRPETGRCVQAENGVPLFCRRAMTCWQK